MKVGGRNSLLLLVLLLLLSGFGVNSLSYDYTASTECLVEPQKPQYGGGIITNPELNDGLNGWSIFGIAKIQHRESNGNKFIVAHNRSQPYDSVSQKLYLQKDHIYTFSAWIRVSHGNEVPVTATLKTRRGYNKHAGSVSAKSQCWSFLKGGLTVDSSGPAELYFESKDTSVEIWIDSISLQPFTQNQWKSHQLQSIEKARKSKVRIKVVDSQGNAVPNATLSIEPNSPSFPFGCAINDNILAYVGYQNWFTSRGFTVTTFEDEMKWYTNEPEPNKEDYSKADAMLELVKGQGISVRGHNVFWDDPNYQPYWVKSLDNPQLYAAATKRLNSVISRYKGQLVAWDVVNENLHSRFFEDKLGNNASAVFYNWASGADPGTTMFLNEFNTIESSGDAAVAPSKYVEKVKEILRFPGNEHMKLGIGLEAHFEAGAPNLAYVRSGLDLLASTGLPIWITELDVKWDNDQAKNLETLLRELHSHPAISGIVLWSAWKPAGCWHMCLTDNNFKNLPTGDVVDKLLREWGYSNKTDIVRMTDASGFSDHMPLFHGNYRVKVLRPTVKNYNYGSVQPSNNNNLSSEHSNYTVISIGRETSTVLIKI